jgi:hypothetical protein
MKCFPFGMQTRHQVRAMPIGPATSPPDERLTAGGQAGYNIFLRMAHSGCASLLWSSPHGRTARKEPAEKTIAGREESPRSSIRVLRRSPAAPRHGCGSRCRRRDCGRNFAAGFRLERAGCGEIARRGQWHRQNRPSGKGDGFTFAWQLSKRRGIQNRPFVHRSSRRAHWRRLAPIGKGRHFQNRAGDAAGAGAASRTCDWRFAPFQCRG